MLLFLMQHVNNIIIIVFRIAKSVFIYYLFLVIYTVRTVPVPAVHVRGEVGFLHSPLRAFTHFMNGRELI